MRILVVEDNEDFREEIASIIESESKDAEIIIAKHFNEASSLINEDHFDMIILDLSIPTDEQTFDETPKNGHIIFKQARTIAPGTPVFVLTGSSADDFVGSLMSLCNKGNIWGDGQDLQLATFHAKHNLDTFPQILRVYTDNLKAIKEIELNKNNVSLNAKEDRILRIFTRSVQGVLCSLTKISEGLSGANVLRVVVKAEDGTIIRDAIAKLDDIPSVKDEDQRYNNYITRLNPDATPRRIVLLEHGAKDLAGIFYGLAEGYTSNAFCKDILHNYHKELIENLENITLKWNFNSQSRKTISEIRKRILSDTKYEKVIQQYNLEFTEVFEESRIQVSWGVVHGDLHGLNILTKENGKPTIIDYGDTAEGPLSLDPITLEFSLFFHKDGPLKDSEWPTKEQAEKWYDLDIYLTNCPYPEFIKNCREWAKKVAAGERELAVIAYGYLLRQLTYSDVNAQRALDLIQGVRNCYQNT